MKSQKLDAFTLAYLECALWSSVGETSESLDEDYSIEDCSDELIAAAVADCNVFRAEAGSLLADWDDEQAGHDFWLTRNGHGTGFWDRAMGDEETRQRLTTLAHSYGEVYYYVSDNLEVCQ